MNREPGAATTLPDRVTFTADDYRPLPHGICAECLAAVSTTAAWFARIGNLNRGRAREVERCQITTPAGRSLLWEPGRDVPCDGEWVAELVRLFGDDASWTGPDGSPLSMIAVTTVAGSAMCGRHAGYAWDLVRPRRGGRL